MLGYSLVTKGSRMQTESSPRKWVVAGLRHGRFASTLHVLPTGCTSEAVYMLSVRDELVKVLEVQ